jgi:hypothetical protein
MAKNTTKHSKPKLPPAHDWRTTDADEIDKRRQRAREESFVITNATPAHPVFSNFRVKSASDMAARLFVSRDTLWRLERGDPAVALGTLVTATFILKLHDRLANLAAPASDELALSLDERRLPQRIHRPRT